MSARDSALCNCKGLLDKGDAMVIEGVGSDLSQLRGVVLVLYPRLSNQLSLINMHSTIGQFHIPKSYT